MLREEDHFSVLCWTREGEFIPGCSMTLTETALAVSKLTSSFPVRLPMGREKADITNAVVYLEIFRQVTQMYGLSEYNPQLCTVCLKTYVLSNALLNDGRWVKIGLTLKTCRELLNLHPSVRVTVRYRTKVGLGDDICFVSFFVDPTVVKILEGRKKFCFHKKKKNFRVGRIRKRPC